jgi:hypothetical protein
MLGTSTYQVAIHKELQRARQALSNKELGAVYAYLDNIAEHADNLATLTEPEPPPPMSVQETLDEALRLIRYRQSEALTDPKKRGLTTNQMEAISQTIMFLRSAIASAQEVADFSQNP